MVILLMLTCASQSSDDYEEGLYRGGVEGLCGQAPAPEAIRARRYLWTMNSTTGIVSRMAQAGWDWPITNAIQQNHATTSTG